MPTPSLLQRLKERKLVQWALAYLAGAWVLFEVSDAVGGRLGWPDALYQGLLVILGIGFFVTLVLAWYHGEKGRQRVSGPELLIITLLLLIAGTGISILGGRSRETEQDYPSAPNAVLDDRPAIAVLPFDSYSADPNDAYFADGIHEEITSKLSRISSLRVISRSSVEQYREDRPLAPRIGEELGVGFLLEGSARIAGGRVRLTAQLIDVESDDHLWSEDYDREFSMADVLDVQSEIARLVASELSAVLTPEEERRVAARPTESIEAYNAYRLGRHLWNQRTDESLQESVEQFQRAIELDSLFALAWVGLADAWTMVGWYDPSRMAEAQSGAAEAASRALAIDSDLGEAHTSLAMVKVVYGWDWADAEAEFLLGTELNPNYANGHHWFGHLLAWTGRVEEGLQRVQLALKLDPLSPIISNNLGDILYWQRRYPEAEAQYRATLQNHPDYSQSIRGLSRAFLAQARYQDAVDASPDRGTSVKAYLGLGRFREATELHQRLEAEGNLRQVIQARMAMGDVDGVFDGLAHALDQRLPWVLEEPLMDPYYDEIRSDPRWAGYVRSLGLEGYR